MLPPSGLAGSGCGGGGGGGRARLPGPRGERSRRRRAGRSTGGVCRAVRRPQGDAVHCDLSDGAANPVFRELRQLGLARHGSISVERVDATLTPVAPVAKAGLFRRETAPVWEMVEAVIRGGAIYAPSFYSLLIIAGLIGAVGILTNSQILIVGAMVVGPEYNAIIAVALGFSIRDRPLVRDGLLALLLGFLAAIAITLLFGLAVRGS